ncbi:MAG: hypothetical protein WA063_07220 [Minisyncoccia bacterium]
MFNQFEALKDFFLSLEKLFNDPEIKGLEQGKTKREKQRKLEKFKKIAPRVIARISATNVSEVE